MAGYPQQWSVASRNRWHSNQPGALAKPVQEMVSDFTPGDPTADHMRLTADALREPEPLEPSMDYEQSNAPEDD